MAVTRSGHAGSNTGTGTTYTASLSSTQAPVGSVVIAVSVSSTSAAEAQSQFTNNNSGWTLVDLAGPTGAGTAIYAKTMDTAGQTCTITGTSGANKLITLTAYMDWDAVIPTYTLMKADHIDTGNQSTAPVGGSGQSQPGNRIVAGPNNGSILFGATAVSYASNRTEAIAGCSQFGSNPLTGTATTSLELFHFEDTTIDANLTVGARQCTIGGTVNNPTRRAIMLVLIDADMGIVNKTGTDSGTGTDAVTDVTATLTVIDSGTGTETADVYADSSTTDTASGTDSSDLFVAVESTDSGTFTDQATDIAVIFYPEGSDSGSGTETSSLSAQGNAADDGTLTESTDIQAAVPTSDSGSFSESAMIAQTRSDSGTFSESYANIAQTRSDGAILDENSELFVAIETGDTFTFDDRVQKLRTEPFPTEDPFQSREPAYTRRRAPFRVLAQDIFTKRFIHTDVPLLGDPTLTYTLSGPNMFQAVLQHDALSLQNLEFPLEPYRTWLHVEEDDVIRMSTLLQPFVDDNKSRTRVIEGEGFSWYPKELVYQGEAYEGVQVDPASMIRKIWDHIQTYWSNLGVVVSPLITPVRIGVAKKNVEFQDGTTGENVSFQAGPYDLNWWEVTNLGSEIDKLCKETPIEFYENSFWNASRTDVKHRLELGYPRVGRQRNDIYFQEGMNLTEIIPKRNENKDVWKSDIIVIGAGEGAKAIRGYASENTGRLRRAEVMENQDITDVKRAQAIADFEKQRRRRARYDIDAITINANHSNAPWGSFQQGDDILVEGTVIYDGRIADWNRITSYSYKPKSKRAVLSLSPSESFTYGAIPEVT